MRLALTLPVLALIMTAPCLAQSDDFNPYQAVLDAMPLEQAEPLIVDAYGPVSERYGGIAKPYDGGPTLILMLGDGADAIFFSVLPGTIGGLFGTDNANRGGRHSASANSARYGHNHIPARNRRLV